MIKYELFHKQLLYEGTCTEENFFEPKVPNDKYIAKVHDPEYFYDLLNLKIPPKDAKKVGFPLNEALVKREQIIADGTIKASKFAIENGMAMNIAGGYVPRLWRSRRGLYMLSDQAIGTHANTFRWAMNIYSQ